MQLELNGRVVARHVGAEELSSGLQRFFDAASDSFLILSDGDKFVQVCGGDNNYFILERHEGTPGGHFRCTNKMLGQAEVRAAFEGFLAGSRAWEQSLPWKPFEASDDSEGGLAGTVGLKHLIVILVLVAVAVVYSLFRTFG